MSFSQWTALTDFNKMLRLNYGNRNKRTSRKSKIVGIRPYKEEYDLISELQRRKKQADHLLRSR